MSAVTRYVARWVPPRARPFSEIFSGYEGVRLRMQFAVSNLPHPQKVHKGGEDSYFACPESRSFAVADGVGGWAEEGVDPGLFARKLMSLVYEGVRAVPDGEAVDVGSALRHADKLILDSNVQGGSTGLLGQLKGNVLTVANVGDSAIMVMRPALRTPPSSKQPMLLPRVVFRSTDQTHFFNCPYQFSSNGPLQESPDVLSVEVLAGDVVIAATDGVFDNLFDHQIQALVARHLGAMWKRKSFGDGFLPDLAEALTLQAQRVGMLEDRRDLVTPFAVAAHAEGLVFRGGKLDDTTAILGMVVPDKDQPGWFWNNFQ